MRIDQALYSLGFAASREKAKMLITAGTVFINNRKVTKPSTILNDTDCVEIKDTAENNPLRYVSRGGLKLEKAINEFRISLKGKICADVGASTGGFTDCMLQNGAKKVYAIDVGSGQLSDSLIADSRVVNLSGTNFRYIDMNLIDAPLDFISVDVSFISLSLVLPKLEQCLKNNGEAILLIKPQFEAGRENVGKKGVVKDPAIHLLVLNKVRQAICLSGFSLLHIDFSPVTGPEGNIEYLAHIIKSECPDESVFNFKSLIKDACNELKG